MRRLAYLGPPGTFSEAALRRLAEAGGLDVEGVPVATTADALDAVRDGVCDGAVVPLENSVEGVVTAVLDELATGRPVRLVREVVLPVAFRVLVRPGTAAADVRVVASHPHALAQCRRWVRAELPAAVPLARPSTAEAATAVADGQADAALVAPSSGPHAPGAGLETLADGVADDPGAVTRFVLAAPADAPVPEPSGADVTSLVVRLAEERPGALLDVLTEVAVRGVNVVRLTSRPAGGGLDRYVFHLDAQGHVAEERVADAVAALHRVAGHVRFLGSYPRSGAPAGPRRPGTGDADFTAARRWVEALRAGSGDPDGPTPVGASAA